MLKMEDYLLIIFYIKFRHEIIVEKKFQNIQRVKDNWGKEALILLSHSQIKIYFNYICVS